jgi:hypothetical protein
MLGENLGRRYDIFGRSYEIFCCASRKRGNSRERQNKGKFSSARRSVVDDYNIYSLPNHE